MRYARCPVKLLKYFGIAAILLSLLLSIGEAAPKKGKPQSPLQVSIAPIDPSITPENIKPGDVVELVVTAVSVVDVDDMQISVVLPKGAELLAGVLSWSGPVHKDEKRLLKFTIKAPVKPSGPIKTRVVLPSFDGASFSASAHYSMGAPAKSKAAGSIRPPKKDSKDRDVIEYR